MGLVKIVLSLLANLLGFLKDRQLIEAGKAEAVKDAVVAEQDRVAAVDAAVADPSNADRLLEKRLRD
jgi:hypothetical protein